MDILIVTDGSLLGFADRLTSEGHDVEVFSKSLRLKSNDLFEATDNLMQALQNSRFVLVDAPWDYLDKRAKYYNRPVIGASEFIAIPNHDYVKQYTLFNRFDVPVPRTEVLGDLSEAIEQVLHWDARRTVIKYGNTEFKCDYRDWLAWGVTRVPIGTKILFQEIEIGLQANITGWFDGMAWLDAFSISPDLDTKLYGYDMMAPLPNTSSLVKETFEKLTPYFKQTEYHGPVTIGLVLKKDSFVANQMHIGWKFPLCYSILEFFQDELGMFLNGLAFPNSFKPVKTKDFVAAVQSKCVGEQMSGAPILGINDERRKHFVFHNVEEKDNDFQYTGQGKVILTATAHGRTVSEACERVYGVVEAVKFPEKHYNPMLAASANATFEQLKNWSYINGQV